MTAAGIPALLEPIQERAEAEAGCSSDPCGSKVCKAQRDRARLLAAVKAVEEWCLNLDAVERVNPSTSENLNASAGAVATVLRKSIQAALRGEA